MAATPGPGQYPESAHPNPKKAAPEISLKSTSL